MIASLILTIFIGVMFWITAKVKRDKGAEYMVLFLFGLGTIALLIQMYFN